MKCPNCGAEARRSFCEYCGSEIPKEQPNVIVNNFYGDVAKTNQPSNYAKCPRCSGNSISFHREKITPVRQKQSAKHAEYRTVGICQCCGFTWDPNSALKDPNAAKKKLLWLWWLLLFSVWPIWLSVWFYRTNKIQMPKKWRIVCIAVFWIVPCIVSSIANGG